jgi:hypothetical protein
MTVRWDLPAPFFFAPLQFATEESSSGYALGVIRFVLFLRTSLTAPDRREPMGPLLLVIS